MATHPDNDVTMEPYRLAVPQREIDGLRGVPLGVACFPKEVLYARRRWLEPDYDIPRWTEFARGGHFAALEEPDLLVADVRAFFRSIR